MVYRGGAEALASRSQPARRHFQQSKALTNRITPRNSAKEPVGSIQLKVTGWRGSRAASTSEDGGVASLIAFLERRAAMKKKAPVRIRKSRVEGDALHVTASSEDAKFILMTNNFTFAGKVIAVEVLSGIVSRPSSATRPPATFSFQRNGNHNVSPDESLSPEQITEKFKAVLASRYAAESHFLDLSDLASHEDIKAMGFTGNPFSRMNFFPALMKVVDQSFANAEAKAEAINSVSLARNRLYKVTPILSLAKTLPGLKNLDLSGNLFENMNSMVAWKKEFSQLEHIILQDTKLEEKVKDFRAELIRWYPTLRVIDQQPVTEEEAAAARSRAAKTGPPILPPVWEDRDNVGENFLRRFFEGYDKDRKTLADMFYDKESKFSLSIDTRAMRDPAAHEQEMAQSWDPYIRGSRNLTKITHAPARAKRLYKGVGDIGKAFLGLPGTIHPSLESDDVHKWLLECRPLASLPDPTGQYPMGVEGLLLTVHGEFDELDGNGNKVIKRSFDRTFTLGPGGPRGVRVINDVLHLRAYGGTEAFKPGVVKTEEMKSDEALLSPEQQMMVAQVQKQTGMNAHYAVMCLEQTGWAILEALAAFERERANIPAEAFEQTG